MTFGVMTHVAVMNFMFDIPVKIFSVHLALMALFIFSTDIKRFINVFITNKATAAYDYYNPIKDNTYHKTIFWLKLVFTLILSGVFLLQGWGNSRSKDNIDKPLLYGVWETTHFIKENDTIPPLITDNQRWRYLIIEGKNRATVKMMNDERQNFKFIPDSTTNNVILYGVGEKGEAPNFTYELLDSLTLKLNGELYLYNYEILLKRKKLDDFLLHSRGFNWINERPFNR